MRKEKGNPHQLVTRMGRAIWPAKRSMQRLAGLVLGLCALIGVTQASNVQKWITGVAGSKSAQQTDLKATSSSPGVATTTTITGTTETETTATTSGAPNIVDLVDQSELILRGSVKEVTDGIENGVPYTEVKLEVTEALRGQFGDEYTFRQFGLLKPRSMGNGKTYLGVTPEGWSKYAEGEDVVLFLYKQASVTGLRTTVGLGQGKLAINGSNVESQFSNEGLFENVDVNANLLNDRDKRVLATKKGPVNKDSFMSLVRRAVKDKWVEGGKMRHVK